MDKLFNKWDFEGLVFSDSSLETYISVSPIVVPHQFGRAGKRQFGKRKMNIVERLVNSLMRGGTGEKLAGKVIRTHGNMQGKKLKAIAIVDEAFDIINNEAKENPIQTLVKAIENAAPREDITRIEFGGVSYQVSVDISAQRRVDLALRNLAHAAIMGSFGKKSSLAKSLAKEIFLAAKSDQNSYAVKKKDEKERIARSAR
jgi:small subunit ribosomal protein S7